MNYALILIFLILPFFAYLVLVAITYLFFKPYRLTNHALTRMNHRYGKSFNQDQAEEFLQYLLRHRVKKYRYKYKNKSRCTLIICRNPKNNLQYPLIVSFWKHEIITVYDPVSHFNFKVFTK